MISILLMASVALAEPWYEAIFRTHDTDGDGLVDRKDSCMALEETYNGFADTDGCPDYLGVIALTASVNGERIPNASFYIEAGKRSLAIRGERAVLDDLMPGTVATLAASAACVEGQATHLVTDSVKRIELVLKPKLTAVVEVDVPTTTVDGREVSFIEVEWTGSEPWSCRPANSIAVEDGKAMMAVPPGVHGYNLRIGRIEYPGTVTVAPGETGHITHENTTKPKKAVGRQLSPSIFFDTNQSEVTSSHSTAITELVAAIIDSNTTNAWVIGYADHRGSVEYNARLAKARATAVRAALVERGIPTTSLSVRSMGEVEATNAESEASMAGDRKVYVVIETDKPPTSPKAQEPPTYGSGSPASGYVPEN